MIKKAIKRALLSVGWDLHRLDPANNPTTQLMCALKYKGVDTIFDIGANVGQFAHSLRSAGFSGKIVSFEPLSSAHNRLIAAAGGSSRWIVSPRAALGDHDGEIEVNIAGNSFSSSVLPMLDTHSNAAKNSAYVASELAPLVRLDSVAAEYINFDTKLFVKIDTQGYEWQVLDGATKTLSFASGVLLEASYVPLYDGQRLWRELVDRMEASGFDLWAIQNGFTEAKTGRSLQADMIFLRSSR